MTAIDRRTLLAAAAAAPFVVSAFGGSADAAVTVSAPRSAGFSPEGLAKLNAAMHALVDDKKLAGVVTLAARHGKVVNFDAYGAADAGAGAPMKKDTIFRIASMTKPIVGVAMMTLWEEGKWKLDDPVAKFIPEFADLKVSTGVAATAPLKTPMLMKHLMSHTAGFDVNAGYDGVQLSGTDLQGMIDILKTLPLAAQPGADWRYGPSVNIQGYIVEKLTGQGLDVVLQKRIFDPCGMKDTQFWVDPAKKERAARIHSYDGAGKIVPAFLENRVQTTKPRFLAGTGGLWSTAEDYWRFCQMLLNRGRAGGRRIIKPSTIELMHTNVLEPGVKVDTFGPAQEGLGFGLDFAIVMDQAAAKTPMAVNSFYWGGAFGTWFWIDPVNDLIFVGMIQNLNGSVPTSPTPHVREISPQLLYAALTK